MTLDIYTIVFFALAVAIFILLYRTLGRTTGAERPPFVPPAGHDALEDADAGNDNVVTLPRAGVQPAPRPAPDPAADAAAPVVPETAFAAALRTIVAADRGFDPGRFLDGAKVAYEMIVTSYAAGDRRTLKNLLSKEVMDGFGGVIDEREKKGEKIDFTFVGVERAEIIEAEVEAGIARLTVRVAAKVVSVTRDAAGTVVDGDPARLVDLVDVWTFARELRSADPNWRLVDTRAVA